MKWRSPYILAVIILAIIIVMASFTYVTSRQLGHSRQQTASSAPNLQTTGSTVTIEYSEANPPTPGPGRMTYINTKYGYSFVYPDMWKLNIYSFQNIDTVQGRYQVEAGDGYPFDVNCAANPSSLDALSWWKQNGNGIGIGFVTLKSGINAYFAGGSGQTGYKEYSLVHNNAGCLFVAYIVNPTIDAITDAIANSFTWN